MGIKERIEALQRAKQLQAQHRVTLADASYQSQRDSVDARKSGLQNVVDLLRKFADESNITGVMKEAGIPLKAEIFPRVVVIDGNNETRMVSLLGSDTKKIVAVRYHLLWNNKSERIGFNTAYTNLFVYVDIDTERNVRIYHGENMFHKLKTRTLKNSEIRSDPEKFEDELFKAIEDPAHYMESGPAVPSSNY
jgi:hypothetical protein